jgi:predicted DNA-binding transcriptional regulator YafY
MKRQARLLAIMEHLRGRRTGITAESLAERFGVTVRTIYRDLDALRDAEIPLQADRGPGGGYALDRSYSLPPINFNPHEAALLLTIGRWATEMRLLPFTAALSGALDKVRGALSASAQRELIALMGSLSFTGVPALPTLAPVQKAIERAWFERRPLLIRYRASSGEITRRTIRIRAFLFERSITLIDCLDLDKDAERQLRLDRIEEAEVVEDRAMLAKSAAQDGA